MQRSCIKKKVGCGVVAISKNTLKEMETGLGQLNNDNFLNLELEFLVQ